MLTPFNCVWLFVMLWTVAHQAPLPWDSPGKNTGVNCHLRLQGIFPTQDRTYVSYIFCIARWVLYHYHHQASPIAPCKWIFPNLLKNKNNKMCSLLVLYIIHGLSVCIAHWDVLLAGIHSLTSVLLSLLSNTDKLLTSIDSCISFTYFN